MCPRYPARVKPTSQCSDNMLGRLVVAASLLVLACTALTTEQESLVDNSTTLTANQSSGGLIVGLFDGITGLTHGVGGLLDQFEEGFDRIRPENETAEQEEPAGNITSSGGSQVIVGLFDTLRGLTKVTGELVDRVEDGLTNRRQDVVGLAQTVRGEVGTQLG